MYEGSKCTQHTLTNITYTKAVKIAEHGSATGEMLEDKLMICNLAHRMIETIKVANNQ